MSVFGDGQDTLRAVQRPSCKSGSLTYPVTIRASRSAVRYRRYSGPSVACHRAPRRHSGLRRRYLALFGLCPFPLELYADGGCSGDAFQRGAKSAIAKLDIEIVRRSHQAMDIVVPTKRWIVERTLSWLNGCRRLAKDWECLNRKALSFLHFASIRFMLEN
jgi:transposase